MNEETADQSSLFLDHGYLVLWLLEASNKIDYTDLLSLRLVSRGMRLLLLNSMKFAPTCSYEEIREKEEQLVSHYKISMTDFFFNQKKGEPLHRIFDLLSLEKNNFFTIKFEVLVKYRCVLF